MIGLVAASVTGIALCTVRTGAIVTLDVEDDWVVTTPIGIGSGVMIAASAYCGASPDQ